MADSGANAEARNKGWHSIKVLSKQLNVGKIHNIHPVNTLTRKSISQSETRDNSVMMTKCMKHVMGLHKSVFTEN